MVRRVSPMVTVLFGLSIAACGGGKQAATTPDEGGGDDEVVEEDDDGGMVDPERMDAITIDLDRKRQSATRCLTEAIDAGEADTKTRGRITLEFVIQASGKPRDVNVIKATLKSQMVQDCVVAIVSKMDFGALPRDLDWSYTFAFEAY